MVLISAVTPAPDDGSRPAMVRTMGGVVGMRKLYSRLLFEPRAL
jgi:hypothetical protein